jgi:hypothetical protein
MKYKCLAIIWLLALISAIGVASSAPRTRTATEPAVYSSAEADAMRLEGEKDFGQTVIVAMPRLINFLRA